MNITTILEQAATKKIAVIGDFILDVHMRGSVDRVSPEAPVLVCLNPDRTLTPGGAGNVYMNLCNLGVQTHLYCNSSDPFSTMQLLDHVNGESFINQNQNAIKTRVMSGNHHLLRLDTEIPYDQIEWLTFKQFSWWRQFEENCGQYDCIVFADYHKGVVSDSLINGVMELAAHYGIPVVVDAKRDFHRYKGATVVKCNKKEWEARDTRKSPDDFKNWVVTLGASGMFYFDAKDTSITQIDGVPINIVDVCGAGDTVTAIIAIIMGLSLLNQTLLSIEAHGKLIENPIVIACELANIAAAEVCSHAGVYAITKEDLIRRYDEVSQTR